MYVRYTFFFLNLKKYIIITHNYSITVLHVCIQGTWLANLSLMMNGFNASGVDLCSFSEPFHTGHCRRQTLYSIIHLAVISVWVRFFLFQEDSWRCVPHGWTAIGSLMVCVTRYIWLAVPCSSPCWYTYRKDGSSTQCMEMRPFTLTTISFQL